MIWFLFINGLPIITMNLKIIGQDKILGIMVLKQYKEDRDSKEPLLNFIDVLFILQWILMTHL